MTAIEKSLAAGWLVALSVIEIWGRGSTSDAFDGLMLCALFAGLVVTMRWPGRPAVPCVALVKQSLGRALGAANRWKVVLGVDLTGSPVIPRSIPKTWCAGLAALATAVAVLAAMGGQVPSGARLFLAPRFYLGYLAILTALWLAAALATLLCAFVAGAGLHDWFVERYRGHPPRALAAESRARLVLLLAALACAALLPLWFALALHAALFVACSLALLVASPGLEFVWKYKTRAEIRSIDGRLVCWLRLSRCVLIMAALCLACAAEALWTGPWSHVAGVAPVTLLLGRCLANVSLFGHVVLAWVLVRFAAMGIIFNPKRIERRLKAGRPGAQAQLQPSRRAEIGWRRQIVRRLRFLFHRAARQHGRGGTGFWIALQHWYYLGLSRDHTETEYDRETTIMDNIIGPPYHALFTAEARYHYWRVTKALQLDLLFVENGVSFRRLTRVLHMMFEIYDVHGGRQRAEEFHFTGLPGVRVIIHEFNFADAPAHGCSQYPEPEYKEFGRARVLHVFKDRGECAVETPVPAANQGRPLPVGAA